MESDVERGNGEVKEVKLLGVNLKVIREDLEAKGDTQENLDLIAIRGQNECRVSLSGGKQEVLSIIVSDSSHIYRAGPKVIFMRCPQGSAIITTSVHSDASALLTFMEHALPSKVARSKQSVFSMRTDESSAKQYFQFYGYLSQQQNMLQDYIRTGTYQSAMLQNTSNFKDKVVLDVGAGTGVLSFFALQAGARKVYAIEASNMAICCRKLVTNNKLADKMEVIVGKVEEVDVPEKVDMIISEPMGYMLFNERMLETYLHAKKWLKEGGNMFPTKGILYVAPFNDEALYLEQFSKANFWTQSSFHGIDVSSLRQDAIEEYFKQPVLDTFDVRIVTAKPVGHTTNFLESQESDLINITIPLEYKMWSSGMVHGLAFWFDCAFCGSESTVWLSTAPFQPLTHWYQIRLLLPKPMFLHKDQEMTGTLYLCANERQSYDVTVELDVAGLGIKSKSTYDLKNPNFRYMSTPPSVPGTLHANPTDSYFQGAETATNSAAPYLTNSHSSPQTTATQYAVPHSNSHGMSSVTAPSGPHLTNSVPSQSLLGPTPSITPSPTLNPSAPQFVPLPDNTRLSSSNSGILTTPSAGGYFQSNALYMMGSQQMVYSQCPSNIGGGGGSTLYQQGTTFVSNGDNGGYNQAHTMMDVHQTRHNPYGIRNHYY